MTSRSDKKRIKAAVERLPEGSQVLSAISSILNGMQVPFTKGSKPPEMPEVTEPQSIKGKPNPMWLVALRSAYVDFNHQWWAYYGSPWPQFDGHISTVHRMAKEQGIDLAALSPETVSLSEIKRVDDLFELASEQLDQLEERIRSSHELALRQLPDAKKKRWARVLKRLRTIQRWCREAQHPDRGKMAFPEVEAWECTHTLRYMLYTMRSTLLSHSGEPEIIIIPPHLVMTCLVVALARKHHIERRIDGVLVQLPPGHFKSWFCIGDRALQQNLYPDMPAAFLHHVAETSSERYRACRKHFDNSDPVGRKRNALFPEVQIDKAKSRSQAKHWLSVGGRVRCSEYEEGVLTSYGVHESAQGKGIIELTIDDPSDEKETNQPGTREATTKALEQTWMQRLRGLHSFFVMICTAWHEDDFASRLISDIRAGRMNVAYYAQACGGPPHFTPICPEIYDRHKLKSRYMRLGAADYARIFQNNPASEHSRRISRVHFYNYDLWTELERRKEDSAWSDFFDSATYYFSLDPAGTETKRSNLAGALAGAYGRLRVEKEDGRVVYMPKLVLTGFVSCRASQLKLSDEVMDLIKEMEDEPDPHKVFRILIESTSGYHATAEHMEERHGIARQRIARMPPGVGTKLSKLIRHGAVLIERGDILFPGRMTKDERGEDVMEVHPEWRPVVEQILQAGTVKDDNLLDCVRQLCEELGPRIFKERESVDREPEDRRRIKGNTMRRKADMFSRLMRPRTPPGRLRNLELLGAKA